jgi:hypothetical protein
MGMNLVPRAHNPLVKAEKLGWKVSQLETVIPHRPLGFSIRGNVLNQGKTKCGTHEGVVSLGLDRFERLQRGVETSQTGGKVDELLVGLSCHVRCLAFELSCAATGRHLSRPNGQASAAAAHDFIGRHRLQAVLRLSTDGPYCNWNICFFSSSLTFSKP